MPVRVPTADLLSRWSDLLMADLPMGARLSGPALASGSLLRTAASLDQIEAAERRLRRPLPASYREFLEVTNGAYGDLYGATCVYPDQRDEAPFESQVVGIGCLPVEDIYWLRERDPDIADIYDEDGEPGRPAGVNGEEVWPWTPYAEGLVIATDKAPGMTCLVFFDDLDEGQVWNIHKESSEAYLSFRDLIEHMVADREPLTDLAEVESAVARIEAGDFSPLRRLGRTTLAQAVPVFTALLERGDAAWEHIASSALGRIGTPEAVEALGRFRPRGWEEALWRAGTPLAREMLVESGRYAELEALQDPRAARLAAQFVSEHGQRLQWGAAAGALGVLARSGDVEWVPLLRSLLGSSPALELEAAAALARLGDDEGRAFLQQEAEGDSQLTWRARVLLDRVDNSSV